MKFEIKYNEKFKNSYICKLNIYICKLKNTLSQSNKVSLPWKYNYKTREPQRKLENTLKGMRILLISRMLI